MDNEQDNTAAAVIGNGDSTPEERENIAGQLAEEQRERVEVEAAISEMSIQYANDAYIGERLLPAVPVSAKSGSFRTYIASVMALRRN